MTSERTWHWASWLCELAGTALMLTGGLSAVFLDFGHSSPVATVVPATSARFLVTGVLFAGAGSLVALSPLGRLSGAHLNPVVTLAFWTQGRVKAVDLLGYVTSQFAGAVAACAVLRALWGPTAAALHVGATEPRPGLGVGAAVAIEAVMTCSLVLTIFFMTSSPRTARWTPFATWVLITLLVWRGAPYTGTSLNPARSTGPAIVAPDYTHLWIYFAGPLAGGALAVLAFAAFRDRHTLTAKLFHDHRYPSTLRTTLPAAAGSRPIGRADGPALRTPGL